MNDSLGTAELSSRAQERQRAMLPGLLTAVKHRRQRRQAVRAISAVMVLVIASVAVWAMWSSGDRMQPRPGEPEVVASSWTTFGNDPTIAERCVVATVPRAEWYVGDDEVNDLLQGAGRRSGIIRAGGRVRIHPAAFDPWPDPIGPDPIGPDPIGPDSIPSESTGE